MTDVPLSITEAATALRAGDLTSTDLTEAVLARADVHDGALGTYLARFDEHALAARRWPTASWPRVSTGVRSRASPSA